jgi:hypothetical protein
VADAARDDRPQFARPLEPAPPNELDRADGKVGRQSRVTSRPASSGLPERKDVGADGRVVLIGLGNRDGVLGRNVEPGRRGRRD